MLTRIRHIHFFSTPSDIKRVLQRFEMPAPLKYAEHGKRSSPTRPVYFSFQEIPGIGLVNKTRGNCPRYIVSGRAGKFVVEHFAQTDGSMTWHLCNGDNEDSVGLSMAGLTKTGTLLPGSMDTLHETRAAQKLMRQFLNALRQERFRPVDEFLLGPEALEMARAGKRLTGSEEAPPDFDFQLPQSFR